MIVGTHEQANTPIHKTSNWPAYNEVLKRLGSLTIWFEPAMTWEAAPKANAVDSPTTAMRRSRPA